MSGRKATKRALLTSVMALVMCVVMLVGTTFAWFTDTAKTSVNTIQAGNLKIALVDRNEEDISNRKLQWKVKNDNGRGYHLVDSVLWEPGCHFRTEDFYLVNQGNLAVKYKVTLSFGGDVKLLEALDFEITTIGENIEGGNKKFTSLEEFNNYEGHLLAGKSVKFLLNGFMKTTAGNEYQGLTLGDIKIDVVATQYTYEYDSTGNQYDKDATYPAANKQDLINALEEINNSPTSVKSTIVVTDDFTFDNETLTVSKGDVTLDLDGNELTVKSGEEDGIQVKDGASLTLSGGSGKLTIESGSGKAIHLSNSAASEGKTTLTIKDIDLDIQNTASVKSSIYAYAENGENNIEINMEEGARINIEGERNFAAIQLANNAVLNYNGGEINASGVGSVIVAGRNDAGRDADDIQVNFNGGLICINGGTVIGIECNYFATANMNGGTIRIVGDNDGAYAVGASFGGYINLNGGKIEVKATDGAAYAAATFGNYSAERKSTVTIGKDMVIELGDAQYNRLADLYSGTVLADQRS